MEATTRRQQILHTLSESTLPIRASELARTFSVSRQIIVSDIALLRAGGSKIISTPRGYILEKPRFGIIRQVACRHTAAQMRDEMYAMVDQGVIIENVIVEHPIYGEITGNLNVASRLDVDRFIEKCNECAAAPLSILTEGTHLHTINCPDEESYQATCESLRKLGILLT